MRRPTLFLVCGLPGSGKTTRARMLEQRHGAVRLCPDEWMASLGISLWDVGFRGRCETLQWQLGRRLLETGTSVVVEWGTWSAPEREALRQDAESFGADVELHLLDTPLDVLWARIQARAMEDPPISQDDLRRWESQFERPTREEQAGYTRVAFDPAV